MFFKMILFTSLLVSIRIADAHHYKGLPHNDYFENYPQVPTLEFLVENDKWEVFMTIFNFDGLDLENVEDNKVVRFYIFLYDIGEDKVYSKPATFEIHNGDGLVSSKTGVFPEQENIYLIQQKLMDQSDLKLKVFLVDEKGKQDIVEIPFQIKKSFWQKAEVPIYIVLFFLLIAVAKFFINRQEKHADILN